MFTQQHIDDCMPGLISVLERGAIIAVLFADTVSTSVMSSLREVIQSERLMLDTAGKGSGSLLKYQNIFQLEYFVNRSRQAGLLTGLAGSLSIEDVPTLLKASPDYIGFRTALCSDRERVGCIDKDAIRGIRNAIPALQDDLQANQLLMRAGRSRGLK